MLIYSGTWLSLLMLFAAGVKDIAWDFISQTLYISHGHSIGLLAALKKRIYTGGWLFDPFVAALDA